MTTIIDNTINKPEVQAIIDKLIATGGEYVDDHNPGKGVSRAQWFGIFTKPSGHQYAFIGFSTQYFCINGTYISDEDDKVHVSRSSVGGVVRGDRFPGNVKGAVEQFNEDYKGGWNDGSAITEYHLV